MTKKQQKMLTKIIIASVLLVGLYFIPISGFLRFFAYMIPYYIVGSDILRKAFKGIKNRQPFDESLLMAIATVGAILLALYQEINGETGDYVEAIAVMLFYQIGEFFQGLAVAKSRKNIAQLMDIRPDYANIEKQGQIEKVDPSTVQVGDIILVQPGEKIPLDGIIVEGKSSLNTVALTGESVPRGVITGDEVFSGQINLVGVLKIKTTKIFEESTASKILDLVENAGAKKSKSENFISKFARLYTPVVVCSAVLLMLVPPIFRLLVLSEPALWGVWIYRALTFLVISCPCALVVSIPLSFFAGIGGASRAGILVKGSNYLETLSKVKTVVFDKTGTLTKGVFEVSGVHHNQISDKELLEYAALAESASSHPIALSLKNAYKKQLDRSRVSNVQEFSGNGVSAKIDGKEILVGNEKLMAKFGIQSVPCHSVGTIIHMAINAEYAGHIVIADEIKESSSLTVDKLKNLGIKIVMLTGDLKKVADAVADRLKLKYCFSELLPAGKVKKVEELLAEKKSNEMLAFVGDGINDAPVLARADVGIAMGAIGSDAAIEAADVVLMDDNPLKVVSAIEISKKCLNIVFQNIVFALGVKGICLILGALGIANMWLAVFADVGVMVLCVLNAFRAMIIDKR